MIKINFFKNFNIGSVKSLRGGAGEHQAKPVPARLEPGEAVKVKYGGLDAVNLDGKGGQVAGKVEHQPFSADSLVDYQPDSLGGWKLNPGENKFTGTDLPGTGYKESGAEQLPPTAKQNRPDELGHKVIDPELMSPTAKQNRLDELGHKVIDPEQMSPTAKKLQPDELGHKEMGPESMAPRNLRGGAQADEVEFKNFKNTQATQTSATDDELQPPKDSGWIKG